MIKHVEYLDGFQYTGGELNFFPHAEGYVNVVLGTTGNRIYNYVYNYTDHLGNIRLSYTKDMVDNKLKIMDENHYYPFGLKHQKYTAAGSIGLKAIDESTARPGYATSTPYAYKYNGKEFQDELGLNMYDMDMRQYDPAIARWVVMDPVIHHSMSPYNSFDNNPVFWADPSGADSAFDNLGESVASVTNMASGVSIGAGGASSSKSNSSEGSSKSGDKSPIGGVSGEFDHSLFDGDPDNHNPNATVLPEVVASNSAEFNAGLESRAIMALQRWNHHNFGPSISSWDGVRRAQMTWSSPNSYFFGDPSRRIAMGVLQGGADVSVGYGLGKGYKAVGGLFRGSNTSTRVFWSGGGNPAVELAARDFATANGMTTLEMTRAGQNMINLTQGMPWEQASPMWQRLSSAYAQGANGTVHVFHNSGGVGINSVWGRVEYPILQQKGVNIIYHMVP